MKSKRFFKVGAIVLSILILVSALYFYDRSGSFAVNAWSSEDAFNINDTTTVSMGSDNQFKIVQVTDLHFALMFAPNNRRAYNLLDKMIERENPDLVVVTGDLTISLFNRTMLKQFAEYMENKQVYWAYTLGNHDYEFGSGVVRFLNVLNGFDYCLFKLGPTNIGGYGNYFINITDSVGDLKYSLCMLDTSRYCVERGQVEWYEWYINNINNTVGTIIPNLMFMHIPMQVVEENKQTGILEKINSLRYENELYEKLVELNSTQYVFHGHDHLNNFELAIDDITFCALSTSGYSGYGRVGMDRTFKVINLNNDNVELSTLYSSELE